MRGVRPIRSMADDRDLGRRRKGSHHVRGALGGHSARRIVAFLAAIPQHREDERVAQAVALQGDELIGIDRQHGAIAVEQRKDDGFGNASLGERHDLIDGHRRQPRRRPRDGDNQSEP